MRHMVVGLMVFIGQIEIGRIEMTQSEMACCWKLWIGEVLDTGITLVLILIDIMIVIIIIHSEGIIGDIFWMISRRQSHLPLMERLRNHKIHRLGYLAPRNSLYCMITQKT